MNAREPATVLVVDDEPEVADAYAAHLDERYVVSTAYGGREALDTIDPSVDVVLLDRRMPDVSGDEVLEQIRERGLDCRVAMVTAVDPDFDIIEMPVEDYVVKPVSRADLHDAIERLRRCAAYQQRIQEFYSLSAKHAALSANKSGAQLAASDRFQALERRLAKIRADLDRTVSRFDDADFDAVFRDMSGQVVSTPER